MENIKKIFCRHNFKILNEKENDKNSFSQNWLAGHIPLFLFDDCVLLLNIAIKNK